MLVDGRKHERGAALITVMLIVAVMSAVALSVMDDIRYSVRRATNVQLRDQAMWYAMGAERLAAAAIEQDRRASEERSMLAAGAGRDLYFDIEGGAISGALRDASNCFNINSLTENAEGGRSISAANAARYQRLLTALEFNSGEAAALTAAAVDWIDTDNAPLGDGAEDSYYASLPAPHRTANTLFAEVEELRGVRGYGEEIFQRIRPHVCAHPNESASPLNVNTLRPGQGPLLVMAVGAGLDAEAAERVIAERPDTGYGDLEQFWARDEISRIKQAEDARELIGVRTDYYTLNARVVHFGAEFSLSTLLASPGGGDVFVVTRRFGQDS